MGTAVRSPEESARLGQTVDRLQQQIEQIISRQEKLLSTSGEKMMSTQQEMFKRIERRLDQFLQTQGAQIEGMRTSTPQPGQLRTLSATGDDGAQHMRVEDAASGGAAGVQDK